MTAAAALGLSLSGVVKRFGATLALDDVALSARPDETLAVTGPSGAGKTTLCRVVAGLDQPDAGRIRLDGADFAAAPARARGVAFLFESYALYPHMSVFDNVASPLRAPGQGGAMAEAQVGRRVQDMIDRLGIGHLGRRRPAELSGGQKQRVGLARALAQEAATVTLLDEPISHLDAKLRHRLRGEIKRMLAARPAPAIWCTPDGLEALAVGDRVVVLIDGRVEQIGPPEQIWTRPASTAVARLIGDPPMTLLDGAPETEGGVDAFRLDCGARLSLPAAVAGRLTAAAGTDGATLGIAPRSIGLSSDPDGPAVVEAVEPFGKHALITARLGDAALRAKQHGASPLVPGQRVAVSVEAGGVVAFDRRSGLLKPAFTALPAAVF